MRPLKKIPINLAVGRRGKKREIAPRIEPTASTRRPTSNPSHRVFPKTKRRERREREECKIARRESERREGGGGGGSPRWSGGGGERRCGTPFAGVSLRRRRRRRGEESRADHTVFGEGEGEWILIYFFFPFSSIGSFLLWLVGEEERGSNNGDLDCGGRGRGSACAWSVSSKMVGPPVSVLPKLSFPFALSSLCPLSSTRQCIPLCDECSILFLWPQAFYEN